MQKHELDVKKEISIQPIPSTKINFARKILGRIDTPIDTYDLCKLSIVLSDGMSVLYRGHIYRAVRGDILFFRPDEFHHARIHREGIHSYMEIFLPSEFFKAFNDDLSDWEKIFSDKSPNRVNFVSLPTNERRELLDLSNDCEKLLESNPTGSSLLLFTNIIRILKLTASFYDYQKEKPYQEDTPAAVSSALQYIHENYQTISGLTEIAENSGCSVTYLTKTFRLYTGETVNHCLTECRLIHARRMLAQGCSVTQTCYESGFNDCSHFIKTFKKSEGATPLSYRKQIYGKAKD